VIRYDIDRCEPVMNIEDYGEWCKYEDVQSKLRLLAEAVLEAHSKSCKDCPVEDDDCMIDYKCKVNRNCQCPACVLAREIMEVSDAVRVD